MGEPHQPGRGLGGVSYLPVRYLAGSDPQVHGDHYGQQRKSRVAQVGGQCVQHLPGYRRVNDDGCDDLAQGGAVQVLCQADRSCLSQRTGFPEYPGDQIFQQQVRLNRAEPRRAGGRIKLVQPARERAHGQLRHAGQVGQAPHHEAGLCLIACAEKPGDGGDLRVRSVPYAVPVQAMRHYGVSSVAGLMPE